MDGFPRGPLFKSDSDQEPTQQYDSKEKYHFALARWRESATEEALSTARLSPEIDASSKYVSCLMGNFRSSKRRARYKSNFFDDRIGNARQSDLALLTDVRPTVTVSSTTEAYKQHAEMCQMALQSEWELRNIDLGLVRTVDICQLNGTSFGKIGACLPGMMQMLPCGPDNVQPIQPGFDIQQSTAVRYITWKGLTYFRNKFPYSSAGLEKESSFMQYGRGGGDSRFNRPGEIPQYTWDGLSPAMQRALGVESSASSMTGNSAFTGLPLQEFYVDDPSTNDSPHPVLMRHPHLSLEQHNYWYWVKPGERLYPRKRLIIFAGRRPMYDGPAPFWHGLYPFACMRLNPVPWSFWGLSKYRSLLPLNEGLNDIGAGIMDMIQRALNPTVVTPQGKIAPAAWKEFYPDLPGGKLQVMPNSSVNDVRYMDPPNIPSWVVQFHTYLSQEFDRISGAVDVTALGRKKQVPGGDTIEQMREMQNSVIRLQGRYIEKFIEDMGQQAVSNFFQFWTLDTRMKRMGAAGISWSDFDSNLGSLIPDAVPKHTFWLGFGLKIGAGSLLNNAKDREKQIALGMGSKGMLPLKFIYRTLDLPDPAGLYGELLEEHKEGIEPSGKSSRLTRSSRNGKVG